jgi:murein DD-endopeptidase MepM/ murein hydrolase activator NlpD
VGNHVILEIEKDRFVLLAHLMKGSVAVAEGAQVHAGQLIARCGNSGNTSQPHLHLQVQDRADVWATDLKTVPILFRDAVRVRAGHSERLPAANVRRNDELLVPDEAAQL